MPTNMLELNLYPTFEYPASPPETDFTVMAHHVGIKTANEFVLSLVLEGCSPGESYTFGVWLYLPSNFVGNGVFTSFWGFKSFDFVEPNLEVRDHWQYVHVTTYVDNANERLAPSIRASGEMGALFYSAGWQILKKESEKTDIALGVLQSKRREYRVISLYELNRDNGSQFYDKPAVRLRSCLPGVTLDIAPVSFGDKIQPDFDCIQYPVGWSPGQISVPMIDIYTLRDAIIHGESGIVTVGDFLIRDTLRLASYETHGIEWSGPDSMTMRAGEPSVSVGRGAHIFCGYPGTRNYAHFLMDIVSSAFVPPFSNEYAQSTIIISHLFAAYQKDYLSYFPELRSRAIFVKGHDQVFCSELDISTFSIMDSHHFPHPYHIDVMRALRARMKDRHPVLGEGLPKKIYVNRLDSNLRQLQNEGEVIEICEKYGFTSLTLSGMSVAQQVALFENATHIVTPHGAGCTNILFCAPQTNFLELLSDKYVQWSMRRIGSLVPVRYGCVIGRETGHLSVPDQAWKIDLEKFESAMQEMLKN